MYIKELRTKLSTKFYGHRKTSVLRALFALVEGDGSDDVVIGNQIELLLKKAPEMAG